MPLEQWEESQACHELGSDSCICDSEDKYAVCSSINCRSGDRFIKRGTTEVAGEGGVK